MLAFIVPPGWIALLGAVPLALGLRKLWSLRKDMQERAEDNRIQGQEHRAELRLHSQALAVAGVTIANGGDNIGVYVPLFASSVSGIATYAATFAVMTGLWCALGYAFVSNRVLGGPIRRYGHIALPIVLIALGLYILSGATTLVSL
jgi:cadmium resistance protein CadD (predicted permease)